MSTNKDNEVKESELVADGTHITRGHTVAIRPGELPMNESDRAEYFKGLADANFEHGEYKVAVDLYHRAMFFIKPDNLIYLSLLQASLANTYTKLHDLERAAIYYSAAQRTVVGHLSRSGRNMPTQKKMSLMRLRILAFIAIELLFVLPIMVANYVGFVRGDTSVLPGLMLPLLVIAITGYGSVYANSIFLKGRQRKNRRS